MNYKVYVFLIPVIGFILQTFLIYSDSTGYKKNPLSINAIKGKQIWLQNNCQTCHQIYGFGGFLGPDLTNRGKDYPSFFLKKLLLVGPKQMPSIYISDQEALCLFEYFKEIDKTGKSQCIYNGILNIYDVPWFTYIV